MSKRVFILDDDPIHRAIIAMMISKQDSSVTIHHCENGRIGLEQLKDIGDKEAESIVLLDINMPVLDGWGVLNELESSKMLTSLNLRIFILSSSTDDRDILSAKKYDFIEHFYHKPLDKRNILTILNS